MATLISRLTDFASAVATEIKNTRATIAGKHPLNGAIQQNPTQSEKHPWEFTFDNGRKVYQYGTPDQVGVYDTGMGFVWRYTNADGKFYAANAEVWTTNNFNPSNYAKVPLSALGTALRIEAFRDATCVSTDRYGAFADGASHPLSSKFASLAAAQAVYPFATALTQEIDWCAATAALKAIMAVNGGKIIFHRGTHVFGNDTLDVSNAWNVCFEGDGMDNTIIVTTSATQSVFYSSTVDYFRVYSGFTVTSTVKRTGGAYFAHYNERRTTYHNVKCTKHFNAWDFRAFEQTTMFDCYAVDPAAGSAAGASLILGRPTTDFGSGNFCILSCFFRGNNDVAQGAPVGGYGLIAYNVDAIFGFNTDFSAFYHSSMVIQPDAGGTGNGRSNNNFFVQCFFDATYDSHSVLVAGTGAKTNWSFTGCWFCGGGIFSNLAANKNACGIFFANAGAYLDINIAGGRAYLNQGAGVYVESPSAGIAITGLNTNANGFGGAGVRSDYPYGILINPSSVQANPCSVTGGNHQGNAGNDVYAGPNARLNVVSGGYFASGVDAAVPTNIPFMRCDVGTDLATVASSNNIRVKYGTRIVKISGNANILNMEPLTFGDIVTLKFLGTLTVADDQGNLRLAGNFGATPGSKLTLQCTGTEWEELSRTAP